MPIERVGFGWICPLTDTMGRADLAQTTTGSACAGASTHWEKRNSGSTPSGRCSRSLPRSKISAQAHANFSPRPRSLASSRLNFFTFGFAF